MDLIKSWQDSLNGGSALSQSRYLHRATQIQNEQGQTTVLRIGFEPTCQRAKTFHALDRDATVIGHYYYFFPQNYNSS
jgi:hypothetical protein